MECNARLGRLSIERTGDSAHRNGVLRAVVDDGTSRVMSEVFGFVARARFRPVFLIDADHDDR